jgi:antitoxin component of MazEF toxin-antitoxin module
MELSQRVQKIGGSLMVRIPKRAAASLGIGEGDVVYFELHRKRVSLLGAFPGITWKKEQHSFSKFD